MSTYVFMSIALHTTNNDCFAFHICGAKMTHKTHTKWYIYTYTHFETWPKDLTERNYSFISSLMFLFCILYSGLQCNFNTRSSFGEIQSSELAFMIKCSCSATTFHQWLQPDTTSLATRNYSLNFTRITYVRTNYNFCNYIILELLKMTTLSRKITH